MITLIKSIVYYILIGWVLSVIAWLLLTLAHRDYKVTACITILLHWPIILVLCMHNFLKYIITKNKKSWN